MDFYLDLIWFLFLCLAPDASVSSRPRGGLVTDDPDPILHVKRDRPC